MLAIIKTIIQTSLEKGIEISKCLCLYNIGYIRHDGSIMIIHEPNGYQNEIVEAIKREVKEYELL